MGAAYIAGPMRGLPRYNFDKFAEVAAILRDGGVTVISPHELDLAVGFDPDSPDPLPDGFVGEAIARDVQALTECHSIVLLPGWEDSKGVAVELEVAKFLGLTPYEWDEAQRWTVWLSWDEVAKRKALAAAFPSLAVDVGNMAEQVAHLVGEEGPELVRAAKAGDRLAFELTMNTDEVRTVNPTTGGEKGQKLDRFDLLPAEPLRLVARHYGIGAAKYADRNWQRGYAWSLSFAALQRHAWAFWRGEDIDPETRSPHMAAVVFHAMALMEFAATHPELDDRPLGDPITGWEEEAA